MQAVITKTQARKRTKKSFDWDISATTIDFMQPGVAAGTNSCENGGCGCGCSGCGCGAGEISNALKRPAKRRSIAQK